MQLNQKFVADCELFTNETNNYLPYPFETGQQLYSLFSG